MRFFLDQHVDARLCRLLSAAGHHCWTAYDANLSAEADAQLTVYAEHKRAVLVTLDREFSQRRRHHIIGRHVRLRCDDVQAPAVMMHHLNDLLPVLERHDELFVEVSWEGYRITFPSETWRDHDAT